MLSIVATAAFAQSVFDEDLGLVVDPASSPVTANGIGSPTIAWDSDDEVFVMFFETRIGSATATCPAGTWGIGAASSFDGESWDIWPQLVVTPTAGTPYACVAAHPTTVFESGVFHLWFKAEQGTGAPNQGWGTNNYSGVGYGTVDLSLDDKTADIAAIDAEIAAITTQLDADTLALDATLAALDASLLAQSDEFECLPDSPICAPCESAVLVGSQTGSGSVRIGRDYCQDFEFVVPTTLNATGLVAAADNVRLEWDSPTGTRFCRQRLVGGTVTMTCNGGLVPGVSSTIAQSRIELTVRASGNWTVDGSVNLASTNVQTTTGPIFDAIDDLQTFTMVPDTGGAFPFLTPFRVDAADVRDWLDIPPVTTDEAALRAEVQAARVEARDLRQAILAANTDIAALEAERAVLVNYTQFVTPSIQSNRVALVLNQTFGYPSVVKIGSEWVMLLQQYPDLYRASGTAPDSFTLGASPVLTSTTATWANTEVFEPSMICADDPVFPYVSWVGGRSLLAGMLSTAGASDAVSSDGLTWLLNTTADFLWGSNDDYRHFDVITDSAGALRMYWVQRVGGVNQVRLKATDAGWTATDTQNRVCP